MRPLLIAFILWLCCSSTLPGESTSSNLHTGKAVPLDLGRGTDNETLSLDSFKGKIVVVTFWASWCPPCLKELPVLDAIQNQVSGDRLQVVAINFKESKKTFRKLKKIFADSQLVLTHDVKGRISKIVSTLNDLLASTPTAE